MKKLFLLSLLFFFFLLPRTTPSRAVEDCGECSSSGDCGSSCFSCNGAHCCVDNGSCNSNPCGDARCGSCTGSCGGGTGSQQCRDNCNEWVEDCTNNSPCAYCSAFNIQDCFYGCTPDANGGTCNPPPLTPTSSSAPTQSPTPAGTTDCRPGQGNSCGGNVFCCSTQGGNACEAIPNNCINRTTIPTECSDASQCPACNVQTDCPGPPNEACSAAPLCSSGVCSCECSGRAPCGGGGGGPTPTPPPGCDPNVWSGWNGCTGSPATNTRINQCGTVQTVSCTGTIKSRAVIGGTSDSCATIAASVTPLTGTVHQFTAGSASQPAAQTQTDSN